MEFATVKKTHLSFLTVVNSIFVKTEIESFYTFYLHFI